MKFKKSLLIICLIICLFAIASVSATDTDDSAISSEDTGEIELSHEIESADENLGTSEEQTLVLEDMQGAFPQSIEEITDYEWVNAEDVDW